MKGDDETTEVGGWPIPLRSPGGSEGIDGIDAEDQEWAPPAWLDRSERPPFPIETLPGALLDFVRGVGQGAQAPMDLPGMAALGVVATCIQKRLAVRVSPDWIEPLSIFSVAVARPSERKSPSFKRALAPLVAAEKEIAKERRAEVRKIINRAAILDRRQKALQQRAVTEAEHEIQETLRLIDEVSEEIAQLPSTVIPRFFTEDVTSEALESCIIAQGGRFAVMSAECGFVDILGGRYADKTSKANFEIVLKGTSADGLRVDRVGRDGGEIDEALLTVSICAQPSVFEALRGNPAFLERGMLARLWLVYPHSKLGKRIIPAPPTPRPALDAYNDVIHHLALQEEDREDGGEILTRTVPLSPDARDVLLEFERQVETLLDPADGLGESSFAGWLGKAAGYVVRLAGIFHAFQEAESHPRPSLLEIAERPISADTMSRALAFMEDYLLPHAQSMFAQVGQDAKRNLALQVWDRLRGQSRTTLSARDIFQIVRHQAKDMKTLMAALDVLEEHGYLRKSQPVRPGRAGGRPPTPHYDINPLARERRPEDDTPSEPDRSDGPAGAETEPQDLSPSRLNTIKTIRTTSDHRVGASSDGFEAIDAEREAGGDEHGERQAEGRSESEEAQP